MNPTTLHLCLLLWVLEMWVNIEVSLVNNSICYNAWAKDCPCALHNYWLHLQDDSLGLLWMVSGAYALLQDSAQSTHHFQALPRRCTAASAGAGYAILIREQVLLRLVTWELIWDPAVLLCYSRGHRAESPGRPQSSKGRACALFLVI